MRLLNVYTLQFAEFHGPDKPIYYVTSHRWTDDEMTYKDFLKGRKKDSKGYKKIEGFCTYVRGLNEKVRRIDWIWIDTCCIDKSSSAEITESINSMWKLHTESEHCIAYLHDVRGLGPREIDATLRMADFRNSEWFKRGWTLQELIAPDRVNFIDQNWAEIGWKIRNPMPAPFILFFPRLNPEIAELTGIPEDVLWETFKECDKFSDEEKISWAAHRQTTKPEDAAHCMLGLFDVHIPLIYGEGKDNAWRRVKVEMAKKKRERAASAAKLQQLREMRRTQTA